MHWTVIVRSMHDITRTHITPLLKINRYVIPWNVYVKLEVVCIIERNWTNRADNSALRNCNTETKHRCLHNHLKQLALEMSQVNKTENILFYQSIPQISMPAACHYSTCHYFNSISYRDSLTKKSRRRFSHHLLLI